MKLKKYYNNIFESLEHARILNSKEYKEYMAKRPSKKRVAKPATEKQKLQRSNFSMVNKFTNQISAAIDIAFRKPKKMSCVNMATRKYLKNAIIGDYPNNRIDYAKIVLGDGAGPTLINLSFTLSVAGPSVLNWVCPYADAVHFNPWQQLYILLYNETGKNVMFTGFVGELSDGPAEFNVPPFNTNDEIHCWYFTYSKRQRFSSCSYYVNEFTIEN